MLTAVDPTGVITGFCFGSASTAAQPLAETFFALRARPNPRLGSVGALCCCPYKVHKINGHRLADILYQLAASERSTVQSFRAHI